jgi:hypothetical protein
MSCIENEMGTCIRSILGIGSCKGDCVLEDPDAKELDEVRRLIK